MNRDQLYLLKPDFLNTGTKPYFCPDRAEMVGLLEFCSVLKKRLDIHYVEFPRPRPELALLLGEENQSCPVLLLKFRSDRQSCARWCPLTLLSKALW